MPVVTGLRESRHAVPGRRILAVLGTVFVVGSLLAACGPTPPPPANGYTLQQNQTLNSNQSLTSQNGQYKLSMQADGNLVLFMTGLPVWSTNTGGTSASALVMQADGNLVLYNATETTVYWASGTGGHSASGWYLTLQNDGNMKVYPSDGISAIWASNTVQSALHQNQGLSGPKSQYLTSPGGQYLLSVQADGNVVLYMSGQAVWWTGTGGHSDAQLVMQADGNLVLYNANETVAYWATGTGGHPIGAYELDVQSDGNLVVYGPGHVVIWSAGSTQSQLHQGQSLLSGHYLVSPGAQYLLSMQTDGNLVLYHGSAPVWATKTAGHSGAFVVMQGDGNLVVYDSSWHALWASGTGGRSSNGFVLSVRADGSLAITQADGSIIWSTGTGSAPAGWGETLSSNAFPVGQCTWGAEYRFNAFVQNHVPPGSGGYIKTTGISGQTTGDARYWGYNAAARGWTVVSTPRVNSIVVFQPNWAGAGDVGHVAWVTGVSGSSVTVIEMNFGPNGSGWNRWDTRTFQYQPGTANGQPGEAFILAP